MCITAVELGRHEPTDVRRTKRREAAVTEKKHYQEQGKLLAEARPRIVWQHVEQSQCRQQQQQQQQRAAPHSAQHRLFHCQQICLPL